VPEVLYSNLISKENLQVVFEFLIFHSDENERADAIH
jgi:hypothetical protein